VIAVSSPTFSVVDFEIALGLISQHFQAWEVVGEGRHFLPEVEKRFDEVAPSYDMSFSAHAPLSDINIASLNPRVRDVAVDEVIEGLRAAGRMGFDTYTFHPGFWSPIGLLAREKVQQAVEESIRRIDGAAREHGVGVALENMPPSPFTMCSSAEELVRLLEGTDLGICFDLGHAHLSGTTEAFLDLAGRFVNVHLHDNAGEGDDHLPIGSGEIDFGRVLGRLRSYRGNLVIEAKSLEGALASKKRLGTLLREVS